MTSHPHRYEPEEYNRLGAIVSVVSATKKRSPFFARDEIAQDTIRIMKERAQRHGVPVVSYCFMPDHMHIEVATSSTCNALQFVNELKSLSARASWAHGVDRTIWQGSYWDTFADVAPDDLRSAIAYTLRNPEEDHLVVYWTEYPYCGSLVYTREQLIELVPPGLPPVERSPAARFVGRDR